jgi:hypothetical protein|tara:strand:+ start:347 stop:985 length:639 start_codon:yes stop_codon:yes gene_type:complete
MNYTELKVNIADICESTFTADQYALFTQQAEQKIYNSVQIPALRKNVSGNTSVGNRYLVFPTDLLYPFSLAITDASGNSHFLLNKDTNFIREAYPNPSTTGQPKHYGYFDETAFILGPTPGVAYATELHYGYYPPSIVTAGTTWLGTEFDSALLNGALMEAIRFMKGEADMVALYEKMYVQALTLLRSLGDDEMRQDTYRSGQFRVPSQNPS